MNNDAVEVLAIIQVDPDKKVLCQAPGCNRHIHKAVHVIREKGKLAVIGSVCMQKLYGHLLTGKSQYTGGSSRRLSDEERQLLVDNTEALIKQLEEEFQQEQQAIAEQAKQISEAAAAVAPYEPPRANEGLSIPTGDSRPVTCSYCQRTMMTTLIRMPAMGYKCEKCVAAKAVLPRYRTQQQRRSMQPAKPAPAGSGHSENKLSAEAYRRLKDGY